MSQETMELQSLLNNLGARKALLPAKDKEKAMALVRNGADLGVRATTLDYKTLLHHLALTNKSGVNDPELTELLQKKDAADIRDGYGCSVLMCLIDQVQRGQCSLDDFKKTAMLFARHGANINLSGTTEPSRTFLHQLVLTNKDGINNAELVELLEKNKELVHVRNMRSQTALVCLIDQRQNNQCSLEDFKSTALLLAHYGASLIVCGTTSPFNTLLHLLVLNNKDGVNNKEIAELLQLRPELFHAFDGQGNTPLHALLLNEPHVSLSTFEQLVLAGKSVLSCKDANGTTLLHAAAKANNLEVALYLQNQGFDITVQTKTKNTLLHCAVNHKDELFWQWLDDNNLDINAKNDAGQTALHLAAQQNNKLMIEWLVKQNAFLYTRDKQGKTALSLAEEKGNKEIAALLLNAQNTPHGHLFTAINKVQHYGEHLKAKNVSKGQVAINLAAELWSKAELFFNQNAQSVLEGFPQFKRDFSTLLNSKNNEMGKYRISWSTIIANVVIALTGIGALLMIGQLVYSKATKGQALFFFQQPQTSSQQNLKELESVVEEIVPEQDSSPNLYSA